MTKQELKEYVKLNVELIAIEEQYGRLKADIESPKCCIITDMPRGGKGLDMADKIAKLIDLRDGYCLKWDEVIDRRKQIEEAIDALPDPIERTLMRYKYIDGLTWEEVCVKISYSWERVHYYHGKALSKLKSV